MTGAIGCCAPSQDSRQAQIMYGIAGERRLPEVEFSWLPGYARLAARSRRERSRGPNFKTTSTAKSWMRCTRRDTAAFLKQHSRLGPAESTAAPAGKYVAGAGSKASGKCAVADNTSRIPRSWLGWRSTAAFAAPRSSASKVRWRAGASCARNPRDVCTRGFDPSLGCFVQAYGSKNLDASLLLMPLVGFLPAHDERVRRTVEAIGRTLSSGGLIFRYRSDETNDGLPPGEGAFLACSFWYADNLLIKGAAKRHGSYSSIARATQ